MSEARRGHIREINGPILRVHLPGGRNGEQLRIGSLDIVGETIALHGDDAVVQAYESTEGLRPGEEVEGLGPWNSAPACSRASSTACSAR